uniref:Uncharacterized protein n=1 Tax=Meloidogyne enterolobii TaxID=390850 RepID=A0A6V7VU49_MELEN|nr:unnamed protein product [Meloidogyne enterolobii]
MLENVEQKDIIEKHIIKQLTKERKSHFKNNNYKQLSSMSKKIQSAIKSLQNPHDCSKSSLSCL